MLGRAFRLAFRRPPVPDVFACVAIHVNPPPDLKPMLENPIESSNAVVEIQRRLRGVCYTIYETLPRAEGVAALPVKPSAIYLICRKDRTSEILEWFDRHAHALGIRKCDFKACIQQAPVPKDIFCMALKQFAIHACRNVGWSCIEDGHMLKCDFLNAAPGELIETMAAVINVEMSKQNEFMLSVETGVVRFRPWSILAVLKLSHRDLCETLRTSCDEWLVMPDVLKKVQSAVRGQKSVVLPDRRTAVICSIKRTPPDVQDTWLKLGGYRLPDSVPYCLEVTFDLFQCDDEPAMCVPLCCAWSPTGISTVVHKQRCGGARIVLRALQNDLGESSQDLFGAGLHVVDDEEPNVSFSTKEPEGTSQGPVENSGWSVASHIKHDDSGPLCRAQPVPLPERARFTKPQRKKASWAAFRRNSVKIGRLSWSCQRVLNDRVKDVMRSMGPLQSSRSPAQDSNTNKIKGGEILAAPPRPKLQPAIGVRKAVRTDVPPKKGNNKTKPTLARKMQIATPGGNHVAPPVIKTKPGGAGAGTDCCVGKEKEKGKGKSKVPDCRKEKPVKKKAAAKLEGGNQKAAEIRDGEGEQGENGKEGCPNPAKAAPVSSGAKSSEQNIVAAAESAPVAPTELPEGKPAKKRGRGEDGKKAAGAKRPKAADLNFDDIAAKAKEKFESKKLKQLSVAEMKCFLKGRKLALGGKKADLEARIQQFFAGQSEA